MNFYLEIKKTYIIFAPIFLLIFITKPLKLRNYVF